MNLLKKDREHFLRNAYKKDVNKYFKVLKRVSQFGGSKYKNMYRMDMKFYLQNGGGPDDLERAKTLYVDYTKNNTKAIKDCTNAMSNEEKIYFDEFKVEQDNLLLDEIDEFQRQNFLNKTRPEYYESENFFNKFNHLDNNEEFSKLRNQRMNDIIHYKELNDMDEGIKTANQISKEDETLLAEIRGQFNNRSTELAGGCRKRKRIKKLTRKL